MIGSISDLGISSPSGTGLVTRTALCIPIPQCDCASSTISSGVSKLHADLQSALAGIEGREVLGLVADHRHGAWFPGIPMWQTGSGWPWRRHRPRSWGWLPALANPLIHRRRDSLCTPPIPPVANTLIPACCAANMVPATVVPPLASLEAADRKVTQTDLERFFFAVQAPPVRLHSTRYEPCRLALRCLPAQRPHRARCFPYRAPDDRFCGRGNPCVITVDSSATTG